MPADGFRDERAHQCNQPLQRLAGADRGLGRSCHGVAGRGHRNTALWLEPGLGCVTGERPVVERCPDPVGRGLRFAPGCPRACRYLLHKTRPAGPRLGRSAGNGTAALAPVCGMDLGLP